MKTSEGEDEAEVESAPCFRPLHPTFGAECLGVDFSQVLSAAAVDKIHSGMAKYGVLVFRNATLDDDRHISFARQLGELHTPTVHVPRGQKYRLEQHAELTDEGNIEFDGSVAHPSSVKGQLEQGDRLFHVDGSYYTARRAGYSILRAHKLPPAGTGGRTAFADTRTAYDDLDSDAKARIQHHVICHSFWHSRQLAAPDCLLLQYMDPQALSMARHRLIQLHEPSGRMNMYVSAHAHHVDGWTREESVPIIEALLQHASQEEYTFKVNWENDGDMIMWDNTCVMHRTCGGSYEGKYARDMRRATLLDSSSQAWGLNQVHDDDDNDSGIARDMDWMAKFVQVAQQVQQLQQAA